MSTLSVVYSLIDIFDESKIKHLEVNAEHESATVLQSRKKLASTSLPVFALMSIAMVLAHPSLNASIVRAAV